MKRSLLSEGHGVPVGVAVAGANCPDYQLTGETLAGIPVARPKPTPARPQGLCVDKGYDYDEVRQAAEAFGYTLHQRRRGEAPEELPRAPHKKPRRWVVERTHSWMNRFRRILIRWEKKVANYLAMLHLACATITYRCAGLFG